MWDIREIGRVDEEPHGFSEHIVSGDWIEVSSNEAAFCPVGSDRYDLPQVVHTIGFLDELPILHCKCGLAVSAVTTEYYEFLGFNREKESFNQFNVEEITVLAEDIDEVLRLFNLLSGVRNFFQMEHYVFRIRPIFRLFDQDVLTFVGVHLLSIPIHETFEYAKGPMIIQCIDNLLVLGSVLTVVVLHSLVLEDLTVIIIGVVPMA